jgi:hypothetical protein
MKAIEVRTYPNHKIVKGALFETTGRPANRPPYCEVVEEVTTGKQGFAKLRTKPVSLAYAESSILWGLVPVYRFSVKAGRFIR